MNISVLAYSNLAFVVTFYVIAIYAIYAIILQFNLDDLIDPLLLTGEILAFIRVITLNIFNSTLMVDSKFLLSVVYWTAFLAFGLQKVNKVNTGFFFNQTTWRFWLKNKIFDYNQLLLTSFVSSATLWALYNEEFWTILWLTGSLIGFIYSYVAPKLESILIEDIVTDPAKVRINREVLSAVIDAFSYFSFIVVVNLMRRYSDTGPNKFIVRYITITGFAYILIVALIAYFGFVTKLIDIILPDIFKPPDDELDNADPGLPTDQPVATSRNDLKLWQSFQVFLFKALILVMIYVLSIRYTYSKIYLQIIYYLSLSSVILIPYVYTISLTRFFFQIILSLSLLIFIYTYYIYPRTQL